MKLFSILSFVVLTLVEGMPLEPLDDFGGKEYRPARKMKRSKVDPVSKKVLLGYYLSTEAKKERRRFSVGSTANIPEVNGEPKCQESGLGPDVAGVCVGDITVFSGIPVYSDTEFQNKIALAYETSSITDIDTTTKYTISIDSGVLKFSSNDEDEPNEIRYGGLASRKQLKRVVDGGFGKYEGATGYVEFSFVSNTTAGYTYALYHLY